ncbi:MAG: hypothetical protein WB797_15460 [Nocardioides sp.]
MEPCPDPESAARRLRVDLPALRELYRRFGWEQVVDDDDFAAFDVHGVVLAPFPVVQLARDGRREPEPGNGGSGSPSGSWSTPQRRWTG